MFELKLKDFALALLVIFLLGDASLAQSTASAQYGTTQPQAIDVGLSENQGGYSNQADLGYDSNISLTGFGLSPLIQSNSAVSSFSEYFSDTGMPIVGGIVSNPVQFDISEKMPSQVYFASGQPLPFSQYSSIITSKNNALWVQGTSDWTQYLIGPVGTWLQLIVYTPTGGTANFFEVLQTGVSSVKNSQYQLYPGYNLVSFYSGQAGRHILYYIIANQPSNVVIVDSVYQTPESTGIIQRIQPLYSRPSQLSPPSPRPSPTPVSGDVPVIIRYPDRARTFDVYLDGNFVGTGSGGSYSFSVNNGSHDIRVWDGDFNYRETFSFLSGVTKIIYVQSV